jgi:hypothetical protein
MHERGVACRTRPVLNTGMMSNLASRPGKLSGRFDRRVEGLRRILRTEVSADSRGARTESPRFAHYSWEGQIGAACWTPEFQADDGRSTGGQ